MGLHPSLKIDTAAVKQRTVLTRIERIKDLMKKNLWKEDQAVIGLPKTKILRIKASKATKAEGAETKEGGAPATAATETARGAEGKAPAAKAQGSAAKPAAPKK